MEPPRLGVSSLPDHIEIWKTIFSTLVPHAWPAHNPNKFCELEQIYFYRVEETGLYTVYSKNPLEKGPSSAQLAVGCEGGRMLLDLVIMANTSVAPFHETSCPLPSNDILSSNQTTSLVLRPDECGMSSPADTLSEPPQDTTIMRFGLPSDRFITSIYLTQAVSEICIVLEPKNPQPPITEAFVWRLKLSRDGNKHLSGAANMFSFLRESFPDTSFTTLPFVNVHRPLVPAPFGLPSVLTRMIIDQIHAFHEHQKGPYSEIIEEDGTSLLALCIPKPGEAQDMYFENNLKTGQVDSRRVQSPGVDAWKLDRPRADSRIMLEAEALAADDDEIGKALDRPTSAPPHAESKPVVTRILHRSEP